ncbi:MAG: GTP-binding protein [Chlamydiales bacterium]|jgi:GTP-binding protein
MSAETPKNLPRVAIVGRPNVGKSTLLNRLCGSRIAIVEPTAGVTRDRIAVPARLTTSSGETWVEVIDTGGIGIVDRDDLSPHVEGQVDAALASADLVLFLVDVRDGITPLDIKVAERLRGIDLPVVLVANKAEGSALAWDVDDFRRLGIAEGPHPISAQNGDGVADLRDLMADMLPHAEEPSGNAPVMKVGIIGRRNAGKSTLINQLAQEERMIVSEIPGTTRDAVDVLFEHDGETFVAIDTAGVRKRKRQLDAIEFYTEARARRTIRRSDVVVLMFDVTQKISSVEKNLARYVIDHHKPVVLAANKWDLVEGLEPDQFQEYIDTELRGLTFAPLCFLSAKNGLNIRGLMRVSRELNEQAKLRVSTGELNRVLDRALAARSPGSRGYGVRVRYATQAETSPPTFVLFVNDKRMIGKDYMRYLTNRLREELPLKEVPIRIVLRDKHSGEDGESSR